MSVAAKKWVGKHSPARGSCKTVLAELAWAGDDDGRGAFLSANQLATKTGLHRNTVDRAVRRLEEDGLIVRHKGGRDHCGACAKAQRRVRVFDLIIPRPEVTDPNQRSLFDLHQDETPVVQVAQGEKHQPGASTCTTVVQLEEKRTFNHHHQEGVREIVDQVMELLSLVDKPGWYVDRIAIEAHVLTWSAHKDPLRAASAVIASAKDHEHVNAAKLLGRELEWQRLDQPAASAASRFRRSAPPSAPGDLPDQFAKYDIAMGLSA